MKPFDINSVNLDLPEEINTSLTPLPTPNLPELSLPIILLLVSTLSIALLLIRRKTAN
jgi:hypothetical protein